MPSCFAALSVDSATMSVATGTCVYNAPDSAANHRASARCVVSTPEPDKILVRYVVSNPSGQYLWLFPIDCSIGAYFVTTSIDGNRLERVNGDGLPWHIAWAEWLETSDCVRVDPFSEREFDFVFTVRHCNDFLSPPQTFGRKPEDIMQGDFVLVEPDGYGYRMSCEDRIEMLFRISQDRRPFEGNRPGQSQDQHYITP